MEVYTLFDEFTNRLLPAPVSITFSVESLEDTIKFIMKDEFRTIGVEPNEINLSRLETELLSRINEACRITDCTWRRKWTTGSESRPACCSAHGYNCGSA